MLRNGRAAVRVRRACEIRSRLPPTRRNLSDEAKKAQKELKTAEPGPAANEERQAISIPGPSWLWTTVQPLAAPFRAYGRASKDRPYIIQFSTSLVIYFLGDLASQYIRQRAEHPDAPGHALVENYDTERPLRALCIGGISSIPSYHWFMYLSTHFNVPATWPASKVLSLVYKVAVNQAFFTPIFNSYFFAMQSLLAGDGARQDLVESATVWDRLALQGRAEAAWLRIRETVPTSWYNSMKFWPFVTAFSFTFIPIRHRSAFAGVAAIGWQSYLGILNQRAVEQERREMPAPRAVG